MNTKAILLSQLSKLKLSGGEPDKAHGDYHKTGHLHTRPPMSIGFRCNSQKRTPSSPSNEYWIQIQLTKMGIIKAKHN